VRLTCADHRIIEILGLRPSTSGCLSHIKNKGRRGRDRMVVGHTTTCAYQL
jgi:hypothetical protein